MRVPILLFSLGVAYARVINDCANGVAVHDIKHEKEVLKSDLDGPYQLAIDYDTDTLFFSHSTPKESDAFKSAYLNLKTNEYGNIKGINGGFANAVDSKNHVVYLGGNDGIYTFNFATKKAELLGAQHKSIWQMFFKGKLYFTEYPTEKIYTFENGQAKVLPELKDTKVMLVAVNNNNDIYFSNSTGLYCYNRDKSKVFYVGDYNLNGMTTDQNGNIFMSSPNALYSIKENGEVLRLASIDDVYGIAIDSDNSIIYSDGDNIVRLKPTKTRCFNDIDKNI